MDTVYGKNAYNMRGSRNFRRGGGGGGGPGQSDKKSSDVFFLFVFFCPQLILQKSNGLISKKTIIFQGSRGVQLFPGGWGVQLLIPCRNPYNL